MLTLRLLLCVLASGPAFTSILAQQIVALRGATVIDGTGAAPRADQTIVVKGGRIRAVGARRSTAIPAGARMPRDGRYAPQQLPGRAPWCRFSRPAESGWVSLVPVSGNLPESADLLTLTTTGSTV
jgi:hypothetical protein